jgi:hypothetical protein
MMPGGTNCDERGIRGSGTKRLDRTGPGPGSTRRGFVRTWYRVGVCIDRPAARSTETFQFVDERFLVNGEQSIACNAGRRNGNDLETGGFDTLDRGHDAVGTLGVTSRWNVFETR